MKQVNFAGIDVSAKELVVQVEKYGKLLKPKKGRCSPTILPQGLLTKKLKSL